MFRPVHGILLDVVLAHPEGISVNALASLVRGKAARSIVVKEVRKLAEMGLVRISGDEKHKQKRLIRPEKELTDLSKRFRELRSSNFEDAMRNIPRMLLLLREVKRSSRDSHLVDYLKYKVREELSHVMEVIV
ncbi:MAG: hypothetical protein NZ992_08280 [Candidatus Korarchaeum sp.]|nr:hypothetical protein [Candidatus Korarchaeum sp.]MDW8034823.1 hypothetical protein [Candidatus Korarchaeum sp.]